MDIIPSGNQTWLAGTPTQLYDFPNVTLPFMDCPMIFPYLPKIFQRFSNYKSSIFSADFAVMKKRVTKKSKK
jgi:hypothetical protein